MGGFKFWSENRDHLSRQKAAMYFQFFEKSVSFCRECAFFVPNFFWPLTVERLSRFVICPIHHIKAVRLSFPTVYWKIMNRRSRSTASRWVQLLESVFGQNLARFRGYMFEKFVKNRVQRFALRPIYRWKAETRSFEIVYWKQHESTCLLNGKSLSSTNIKMRVTFPTAIRWTNSAIRVTPITPLKKQDAQL